MRLLSLFALCLTILLNPVSIISVHAATPADVAAQTRDNWAKARSAYLASVKPYRSTDADLAMIKQYTNALDKAGASLDNFLALKLASPPATSAQLTGAVDQVVKNLMALRTLSGKANGGLATALGSALSQQNQIAQTALANMR